ncbi:hypothetical protein EZV73_14895 [Acidaminobacter sp. JC074]|nr:hypothetical protein [Acidaminobacter sp. JC074]
MKMYKVDDYKKVFEQLKLDDSRAVSLYPYAPVFKVRLNDEFCVLKRTKKDENQMNKLLVFQKHLKNNEINVSLPIKRFDEETHIIDETRWVIYPFIEGEPYNGSDEHIRLAGDLLGRLHACNNDIFNHGFTWQNYGGVFLTDVIDDMKTIESRYSEQLHIQDLVDEAVKSKFDHLREIDFPYVDATWDFKATNLIYSEENVSLIDLDNSGYIPRIFDLCLALILFHTSSPLAPNRPFTIDEWDLFMTAYKKHITLTEEEVLNFTEYLKFVYLDEGIYAIVDLEMDDQQRQIEFIKELMLLDLTKYKI